MSNNITLGLAKVISGFNVIYKFLPLDLLEYVEEFKEYINEAITCLKVDVFISNCNIVCDLDDQSVYNKLIDIYHELENCISILYISGIHDYMSLQNASSVLYFIIKEMEHKNNFSISDCIPIRIKKNN